MNKMNKDCYDFYTMCFIIDITSSIAILLLNLQMLFMFSQSKMYIEDTLNMLNVIIDNACQINEFESLCIKYT